MMKKKDLINIFSQLFQNKTVINNEIPTTELKGYFDESKIFMVIPKLYSIKKLLIDNFAVEEAKNVIELDYRYKISMKDVIATRLTETEFVDEHPQKSKYSRDFLKLILKLLTKSKSRNVTFEMKRDFPMRVETDEMIIVLAPVVDNDDV